MSDLVQWLRAQLDEDERIARERAKRGGNELPTGLRSAGEQVRDLYGDPEPPDDGVGPADRIWWLARDAADWIAEHDPARVLREIDAKQQLVNAHSRPHECVALTGSGDQSVTDGGHWELWELEHTLDHGPCTTLRLLALPYADRPGYREEWRP